MAARAYRDVDPHLRTRLLARVAAGERLSAVCAEAGAPSYASVHGWAKAEPAFAAALAAARAEGTWRRDAVIDPAVAEALLARLADGETITSVLRDPAMPSRRVYGLWRTQYAEFAEAVVRINQAKREVKADLRRARRRPFDPVLADRIVARVFAGAPLQALLTADPQMPCRAVVARWRRERRDFDAALDAAIAGRLRWEKGRRLCTPETIEAVSEAVFEGATLAQVGRRPWAPCASTLYAWMRRRREFRVAVVAAWQARAQRLADGVADIAEDRATLRGRGREVAALKRTVEALDARAARWGAG
jgi:hypothetical protein